MSVSDAESGRTVAPVETGTAVADLENLAYSISHDLGAPVRHMKGFLACLMESQNEYLSDEAKQYCDHLDYSLARLERMQKTLAQLIRVDTRGYPPEKTDCTAALNGALAQLEEEIERTGARIDIGPMPAVFADARQLQDVFRHLIANSLLYTDGGTAPAITVRASNVDGAVVFEVKDNGIGIEEACWEHVFRLFNRLQREEDYPGIGAGLTIVNRVIRRHNGRVWITSTPGAGTSVFFSLPNRPAPG